MLVGDITLALRFDSAVRDRLSESERRTLRRRLHRMVRAAWLRDPTERPFEVTVRITGDAVIRALNRDYRHKDQATDVLAFAAREAPGNRHIPEVLGDIVISLDTAERQAKEGLARELLFLAAHGLCHLLGYDHQDDEQEQIMNQRVHALLAECQERGRVAPA